MDDAADDAQYEYEDDLDLRFDWESEEWVLAGQALREAIDFYVAAGDGDRSHAKRDALAALRYRLGQGHLWARAPRWSRSITFENLGPEMEEMNNFVSDATHELIGQAFWWDLEQAERREADPPESKWADVSIRTDWVAGDISYESRTKIKSGGKEGLVTVSGNAIGLCFNRSGLPMTQREIKTSPNSSGVIRKRRAGRPQGSGGFAAQDAKVVEKMREFIAANPEMSVHFTAGLYAQEAAGNAGYERKQRRLADRYRETYPD